MPHWIGFEPEWLQHALRYFTLVGIVVATVTGGVYALMAWLLPPPVAVLLSTIFGMCLTGALHEDGFADVCDGFGGGATPERVLAIMKDSCIGAYGAIGIGMLLALKCVVLGYLPVETVVAALRIGHPLSRLAATSLVWRLDYARVEGKAKPLAQHLSTGDFIIAGIVTSVPVVAIGVIGWLSWQAIVTGMIVVALAAIWLSRWFVRRIGGYTGDCLGTVQHVTEVVFYLSVLAAAADMTVRNSS